MSVRAEEGRGWWRDEGCLCLILFAVALGLRVAAVAYINRSYNTYLFAPDSRLYDGLAQSLAAGEGYAIGGDHREYTRIAPAFPLYLAVLYGLFGRSVQIVGMANAVVGSLTCLVVYGIGRKLLSRRAAALAGLIATAYWEFLFWTPFVVKETLALFLFSGALLVVLESMERESRAVAFLGGCALGLASLTRYPHLAFLPLLVGAFMLCTDRKRLRRLILPLVVGVGLALAPWLARNYVVFGEVLLSNHGPARQLYLTYGPGKVKDTRGYAGVEGLDLKVVEEMDQQPTSVHAREQSYLRSVLAQVVTDPWRVARLVGAKVVNMWRPTWVKLEFQFPIIYIPFAVTYAMVLALGVVGLVLHARAAGRLSLLHVVLIYYLGAHTLWWAEIRNRMYLMPYLILFGAYAVQAIAARRLRVRQASRWGS